MVCEGYRSRRLGVDEKTMTVAGPMRSVCRRTATRANTSGGKPRETGRVTRLRTTGAPLIIEGLSKTYGRSVEALSEVDLTVTPGEFLTLLGPSGSGKTTLLMIVAGFESPTTGRVLLGGDDITWVPPERRSFGVVFQNYALFPHMSVERNVAYPLQVRRVPRSERRSMVADVLRLVDLEGLKRRRPAQLSGGQQQRVALARALVYQPSLLLLDEPLGALDRAIRDQMQGELTRLHRLLGVTFLYVTHDQDEALTMSDRVAVLRDGRIEQIGTPEDVYQRPASAFVARFVGKPNILSGRLVADDGSRAIVRLDDGTTAAVPAPATGTLVVADEVLVLARPEKAIIEEGRRPATTGGPLLAGVILEEEFAGAVWRYTVKTPLGDLRAYLPRRLERSGKGSAVSVCWREEDLWTVPRVVEQPPPGKAEPPDQ